MVTSENVDEIFALASSVVVNDANIAAIPDASLASGAYVVPLAVQLFGSIPW